MTALPAGFLLPQSTLTEPWFQVFALVVGFNTLIYLGLTVAKFLPWPAQIHPSRVRDLAPFAGSEEPYMSMSSEASSRRVPEPFTLLRQDAARLTIPRAMVLIGAAMLVLALANLVAYENSTLQSIFAMISAFVFMASSQVLVRLNTQARTIIAVWTVLLVGAIGETSYYAASRDEPVILMNAVVLLIILAPISMSWAAGILGTVLGAAAVLASGWIIQSLSALPWILASAAAATAGLVLLQLRLTIIDRLAFEQLRANALASTDLLTGVFSRTGLLALAETIASTAAASNQLVHAVVCDIDDLHSVNQNYGMEFGDEVLQVTARALKQAIPKADLVARWDGDSFLALGVGPIAESTQLKDLVEQGIASSGLALGKRALSVTVLAAASAPADTSFEALVALASDGTASRAESGAGMCDER